MCICTCICEYMNVLTYVRTYVHMCVCTENIEKQINSTNATTQHRICFNDQDVIMWNDMGTYILLVQQNVIFRVVPVVPANNVVFLDIKSCTMIEP
jgi:hypothetical protein